MKKLLLLFSCVAALPCFAQTVFSASLKNGIKHSAILIERNTIHVLGYDGNEIKVEIDKPITTPKQADGLKRVTIKGMEDNTGLGINLIQEDSTVVIREVCNCYNGTYTIYMPKRLNLMLYENAPHHGQRWVVKDMQGSFDASTEFGHIYLQNTTGDIRAYSRHGSVSAYLNQTDGVLLSSLYGKIVLELPPDIKADLKIKNSQWNEVFTDFQLADTQTQTGSLTASLNGGGKQIELKADHGNIFLRKKK